MFRKPYKVKTSTTIKGSERRRLRTLVETSYPNLTPDDVNKLVPNKSEMNQVKAMTHTGSTAMLYYSGQNPTFFTIEDRCYPTLYTLWQYPKLLPLVTTGRPVLDKITNGADLMAPGVIVDERFVSELDGLAVDSVCAVRIWGNKAPVAVGVALLSKEDLCQDGVKGKAVQIVHAYTDTLWSSGDQQKLPLVPDDVIDDSEDDSAELVDELQEVKISEVSVTDVTAEVEIGGVEPGTVEDLSTEQEDPQPTQTIPLTPEYTMDDILYNSFMAAIKTSGKKISLPVLTSTFYSSHVLRCCPSHLTLDVKKTTFKKLSVFLKKMQKEGMVQIKELTKGVESIIAINIENETAKSFRLDPIFKQHLAEEKEKKVEEVPTASIQSNYKFPQVTDLHVVSAQVKGLFEKYNFRKGDSIPGTTVKEVLKRYVKENSLQNENNKRIVTLDPTLSDCIAKKDFKDHMTWEELQEAIVCKMPPAYQVQFEDNPPVVKKGKLEPITVTVDTRTGNKKVTLVHNLDTYGINPDKVAHHVQVAVAASTSITPTQNGKGTVVLIQGNQVKYLQKLFLEIFKVPRKHLQGLENVPNKKK
ncbi:hypothetical protein JTE90_025124 [Oedothorax gibbosus]|uniref:Ligatin n=1 Tax=Oedothorax gibbosus TaxID=931172 RepID=A0AAV6UII4_9ARAC|nr:hypothetical protein JTE90_025124 [Oedothorax gibbosus]